jgi:hypothetical protein
MNGKTGAEKHPREDHPRTKTPRFREPGRFYAPETALLVVLPLSAAEENLEHLGMEIVRNSSRGRTPRRQERQGYCNHRTRRKRRSTLLWASARASAVDLSVRRAAPKLSRMAS